MENQQIVPERRVLAAQNRKRADATVAPFLAALKGWHAKASYLGARARSDYSSPEEKSLARLECGALLAEVRRRQAEFQSATKGEPPHGRIDDVDAAFVSLIDQLLSTSDASFKHRDELISPGTANVRSTARR